MRYVIDSSVAFKWVVPEPYSDKARQLRADYENAVHDLIAPNVFPIEAARKHCRLPSNGVLAGSGSLARSRPLC